MKIVLIRVIAGNGMTPNYIPPLGLMYLASSLEAEGHMVMISDAALTLERDQSIVSTLKEFKPDLIGIGGIITAYKRAIILSSILREEFMNVPQVFGGHLASHIPHVILQNSECDYVVHGYGEKTLCELVRRLEKNIDCCDLNGISWKMNSGDVVFNGFPDKIQIDEYPFPAYHLVDMERYIVGLQGTKMGDFIVKKNLPNSLREIRTMLVMASRGCVARCSFCVHDVTPYRGIQIHSMEKLIENISFLYEHYQIRNFLIGEEMFIFSDKKRKEFISIMREKFPDVYYSFPVLADMINPEMVADFSDSNCTSLSTGFESGSERILKMMKKRANAQQNKEAVNVLSKSIYLPIGCIMVGHPGENWDTFKETLELVKQFQKGMGCNVFFTTPYPGSLLYLWAIKNKIIRNEVEFLLKISDLPASKFTINLTTFPDYIIRLMRFCLFNFTYKIDRKFFQQLGVKQLIRLGLKGLVITPKYYAAYFIAFVYFRYRKFLSNSIKKYKYDFITQKISSDSLVVSDVNIYYEKGANSFVANIVSH